jgi:hypothetical protein
VYGSRQAIVVDGQDCVSPGAAVTAGSSERAGIDQQHRPESPHQRLVGMAEDDAFGILETAHQATFQIMTESVSVAQPEAVSADGKAQRIGQRFPGIVSAHIAVHRMNVPSTEDIKYFPGNQVAGVDDHLTG